MPPDKWQAMRACLQVGHDIEDGGCRRCGMPVVIRNDPEKTRDHRDHLDARYRRIVERYDEPLCWLLGVLFERNIEHWLEGPAYRRETIGAEQIREHGLTRNQRRWADEIQRRLEASDDR